jgi:hypothetical protein
VELAFDFMYSEHMSFDVFNVVERVERRIPSNLKQSRSIHHAKVLTSLR